MTNDVAAAVLHDPRHDCWYRYCEPVKTLRTSDLEKVDATLEKVEAYVADRGMFAVGYLSYEAAPAFDAALATRPAGRLPLVSFTLYRSREVCEPPGPIPADLPIWQGPAPLDKYANTLSRLRGEIGAGNVYQVNFTDRLWAGGVDAEALFAAIGDKAPFGAYLQDGSHTIVSASPELFFELDGELLTCRPMKGTAHRGLSAEQDQAQARWLACSEKNRAENLMITDMVRNDLGRVADPGSVVVPGLFQVEQYPTVWQMTSTVQARTNASVLQIFRALFPGASITGAPKRASMALIRELEETPRGVYTGAIGVMAPQRKAQFSIAIRTACIETATGSAQYGVGGGIVWDSSVNEEYQELHAKRRVLDVQRQEFALLETMRWQGESGVLLLETHLQRLRNSARHFAYPYDAEAVRDVVEQITAGLGDEPRRLRLLLDKTGAISMEHHTLASDENPQALMLAAQQIDSTNPLLYHKTTQRSIYDEALASVPPGYEVLLHNERGMVTESNIANVVYRLDGALYTPPVDDGLLPGTLRGYLLREGVIAERSLPLAEIPLVEAWFLINALRGWRDANYVVSEKALPTNPHGA